MINLKEAQKIVEGCLKKAMEEDTKEGKELKKKVDDYKQKKQYLI